MIEINQMCFAIYCILLVVNFLYGLIETSTGKKVLVFRVSNNHCFSFGDVLGLGMIAYMGYIALSAHNVPDYESYNIIYSSNIKLEAGYNFLQNLAVGVGMSYLQFRNVLFVFTFILLFFATKRISANLNIVISLYSVYPFTIDIIQIRTMIASIIFLFSVYYLFENTRVGKIKYTIGILIASLFHSIFVLFLLGLLIDRDIIKKKRKQRLWCVMFFVILLVSFSVKIIPLFEELLNLAFMYINPEKAEAYISGNMGWGFLLYWSIEILFILVAFCHYKGNLYKCIEERNGNLIWFNIVMAFCFPLCIINLHFYRIFRGISLLNYSLLPLLIKQRKGRYRNTGIVLFIVAYVLSIYVILGMEIGDIYWCVFDF